MFLAQSISGIIIISTLRHWIKVLTNCIHNVINVINRKFFFFFFFFFLGGGLIINFQRSNGSTLNSYSISLQLRWNCERQTSVIMICLQVRQPDRELSTVWHQTTETPATGGWWETRQQVVNTLASYIIGKVWIWYCFLFSFCSTW